MRFGAVLHEFLEWEKQSAEDPSKDAVSVVIDQLAELEDRYEAMEAWMSKCNDQLIVMRSGIAQIEAENNALCAQEAQEARMIAILQDLVSRFTLKEEDEQVLDKPFECLAKLREDVERGIFDSPAMLKLSCACSSIRAMTLEPSSFKDESDSLYSTAAVKDRVAWLQNKQDAFCWHVDFFEDRIKSARAGGSAGDVIKPSWDMQLLLRSNPSHSQYRIYSDGCAPFTPRLGSLLSSYSLECKEVAF